MRCSWNPSLLFVAVFGLMLIGCQSEKPKENTMFRALSAKESGIDFTNQLEYSEELNIYTFKNFYNGAGVGIADFNNDSLPDVFLCGNQVPNKLYLNKGGLAFEDITTRSGIGADVVWTTGISVADVNADGFLDIYLCKSGPPGGPRRFNELYINNGDLTFTEKASEFGLDFEGLSTHAAFFDMDRDGDLDCYLLNNSIRSVGAYDLRKDQREIPDTLGGNALLRNDAGKFVDVSKAAGIYSSSIGFGLGVTVGDVNGDHWPDLYVSNDFFEKDYLYINNHNGTFTESLEKYVTEISLGSMGADMADINNDGLPEIFVTEMLPETDERLKTTVQFENWDKHQTSFQQGYYRQFSRNVLQLNNGDQTFSEISRFAHVEATDWSWGALIFDMDNDGWKDIFVANGMFKDLLDQDYINFASNPNSIRAILREDRGLIRGLIDSIPSNRVSNFAFRNQGDLTFVNESKSWGLDEPSFSNGAAYGDLDNDGDLDLIVNNVNMPVFVLENQVRQIAPEKSFISLSLHGEKSNPYAVGSLVKLYSSGEVFSQELLPARGFMSSVDYRLTFGLGEVKSIDSLKVFWPDGKTSVVRSPAINRSLIVDQSSSVSEKISSAKPAAVFAKASIPGLQYKHVENDFVDFDRDPLIFNMNSNEGPCTCAGDVNGDGLVDVYIGGAKDQAGSLFIQQSNGSFKVSQQALFDADARSEDTDCVFFDADKNGTQDLYVTSGGSEFGVTSLELLDRLYFNRGGTFAKSQQLLPTAAQLESSSSVAVADIDADGDLDLFVGTRMMPAAYGLPSNGYILINDGTGNFKDETDGRAPMLRKIGMITDAKWDDLNKDGQPDLVIVGEWMPVKVMINSNGKIADESTAFGLGDTDGWYHSVATGDFNNDGYPEIIAGNLGLNSRFRASAKEPLSMYVNDFDRNGTMEQIINRYYDGVSYPIVLRPDLVRQMPVLKKKYLQFRAYSHQRMEDIFTPEQMEGSTVMYARTLETTLWINGNGRFIKAALPSRVQFSPVYSIAIDDFNHDGNLDFLVGGNQFKAKPETGIYGAGKGVLVVGNGKANFSALDPASSLCIEGEIRRLTPMIIGRKQYLVVTRNNDAIEIYKY